MEKVMLTKEQAHEFESFKALRSSLEEWARDKYDPNAAHSIIHELTFDQAARAFLIGYEVEPEQPKFQVGDKVIVTWIKGEPTFHEVKDVRSETVYINTKPPHVYNSNPPKRIVRHATQEEIYWLETLGRKRVGDFREGDVILALGSTYRYGVNGAFDHIGENTANKWYEEEKIDGIYPAESFKPFPQEESK